MAARVTEAQAALASQDYTRAHTILREVLAKEPGNGRA
jgi:hypothetical protein